MDKCHTQARLASNRTKQAAIYPPQLVDAICHGINEQMHADKMDQNIVARIEQIDGSNVLALVQKAKQNAAKCHEDDHQELIRADYVLIRVIDEPQPHSCSPPTLILLDFNSFCWFEHHIFTEFWNFRYGSGQI